MPLFGPNIAAMKEKGDLAGLVLMLKGKDVRARTQAVKALGELRARSAVSAIDGPHESWPEFQCAR